MTKLFYIEVTDTYAGEANYCWVHRFKVEAKTARGAISKLSKHTGFRFRFDYGNIVESIRYKGKGNYCAFLELFDDEYHNSYELDTL